MQQRLFTPKMDIGIEERNKVSPHNTISSDCTTNDMENIGVVEKSHENYVTPTDSDILGGRGNGVNSHPGNCNFRKLIKENKEKYLKAGGTFEKRQIVREIMGVTQSEGGRFLKLNPENDKWFIISVDEAEKKTSQALREGGPTFREKLKMNSKEPSRTPTTIRKGKDDDTVSPRSHAGDHLLIGHIEAGTVHHNTINDENVKILSRQMNNLRRKMNELKKEYNQCVENHEELMGRFLAEIDPLSTSASPRTYTNKRQLSDSDTSSDGSDVHDDGSLKQYDKKMKYDGR
eukprot:CAMPEP_0203681996 /NCGR_PEP_ID=MMETSP0090-20130426/44394_1 /ASSEMBLY_ACC=CAM_ASM_001088 /TAXON_ID=426623 /ORGANISM="Chaetoceros affinis, Strain CCMP159" /LENGTH=288 /DNA_ID=CAMNT_0050550723 /DNA_START=26 /DNA_END=892 /DNA_ORIENTATION=+